MTAQAGLALLDRDPQPAPGLTDLDLDTAAAACQAMLDALGIDTDRDGVRETPHRFVRALAELTRGRHLDPDRHLAITFPPESTGQAVLVGQIPFTAVCEHHLLVFHGSADVAYLPAGGARIVGLSKLARLVQEYAARPQLQERLTRQIADALERGLDTAGVACQLRSEHSCMSRRGARAAGSVTVTTDYRGRYRDDAALRMEFLLQTGAGGWP
jgi:GTP cyclohydrolase I